MARLPIPGSDNNAWGDVLNDFLSVELNSNGTLKKASDIQAAQTAADNAQTTADSAQSGLSSKADASSVIPKNVIDAKGDLIVGSANDTVVRVGVGSNGQVLTADSAQASGVKWAPAGGVTPLTWTTLPTQPFVFDYGTPYSPLSVSIDSLGIVRFRGLMGFSSSFTGVTTLATLPSASMYPKAKKLAMALDAQNLSAYLVLIFNTDGTISCVSPTDPGKVISFDTISFDTQS